MLIKSKGLYNKTGEEDINTDNLNPRLNYDPQEIIDLYNSLPSLNRITGSLKTKIKAVLKTYSLGELKQAFIKAEQSKFLQGNNDRKWKASFDWIIKPDNIAKILNGNYDDSGGGTTENKSKYCDIEGNAPLKIDPEKTITLRGSPFLYRPPQMGLNGS